MNIAQRIVVLLIGILIIASIFYAPYREVNKNRIEFYYILNPPILAPPLMRAKFGNTNTFDSNDYVERTGYEKDEKTQFSIIGAEIVLMIMLLFVFKGNKRKI
jgi:hypothetical protein